MLGCLLNTKINMRLNEIERLVGCKINMWLNVRLQNVRLN